jgi:hypothetical protein
MKRNLSQFVQDGSLMEFRFEAEPVKAVFAEILMVVVAQENRILALEASLASCAPLSVIDDLKAAKDELCAQFQASEKANFEEVARLQAQMKAEMDKLCDHTDGQCSQMLVDVRRFLNSEVQELIGASDRAQAVRHLPAAQPQPAGPLRPSSGPSQTTPSRRSTLPELSAVPQTPFGAVTATPPDGASERAVGQTPSAGTPSTSSGTATPSPIPTRSASLSPSAPPSSELRDLREQLHMLRQDLNNVRKAGERKASVDDIKPLVASLVEVKLQPMRGEIKDLQADITTLASNSKQFDGRLEAVRKVASNRPQEPARVEVIIQKPGQPSVTGPPVPPRSTDIQPSMAPPQSPPPQPPVEVPVALPPLLDQQESIERHLQRQNEVMNAFRMTLDLMKDELRKNAEQIRDIQQRSAAKTARRGQETNQLSEDVKQLRGRIAQLQPRDYSKELGDLKREMDIMRREFVTFDKGLSQAPDNSKPTIHRPEIRYADRVPPPPPDSPPSTEPSPPPEPIVDESFEITDNWLDNKPASPADQSENTTTRIEPEPESHLPQLGTTPRGAERRRREPPVQTFALKVQTSLPQQVTLIPGFEMAQADLEARVDSAVKLSIGGFLERVRVEVMKEVQSKLKVVDSVSTKIDAKIDREFVERMFNKVRIVVGELKTKIDDIHCTFMGWITREELNEVLEKFAQQLAEVRDTAGAKSKYRCLLCGKPRTHVAGMFVAPPTDDSEDEPDKPPEKQRPVTRGSVQADKKRKAGPVRPRDVLQLLTTEA